MLQLTIFIIFIFSVLGMVFILYKKIPVLVELPPNGHHSFKKPEIISKIEKKIKDTHFHFFEKQMFLHKLLSKAKVWILRTETKIDVLLRGIRKKAQELDKKNGKN